MILFSLVEGNRFNICKSSLVKGNRFNFCKMSCILTRPTRSPKYGVTRNNIPRYYTLNRPRKYIYFHTASQSFRILSANYTFRHILRLFLLFSFFLYVCFSSLFAAGDVSREGTSANQRNSILMTLSLFN